MHKYKSEKGFTGIDITIAIIIVAVFAGIIASLFYNYNLSAQSIQRKGKATEYAVQIIEYIKNDSFQNYTNSNLDPTQPGYKYKDKSVNELSSDIVQNPEDGYYATVQVTDYADLEGNEGKKQDIVKKITVTISYNVQGKENYVDISTYIARES